MTAPAEPSQSNRRAWLRRLIFGGAGSVLGAYTYGSVVERHLLTTEKITVALPGLAPSMSGLRVVQISDLHLYPSTGPDMIERTVRAVNAMEPDLTVITGDFITQLGDASGELSEILKALKARLGVYGVLGNHDCWHNPSRVVEDINRAGVKMLVNGGEKILDKSAPLWIGGTDSVWAGKPDLTRALPKEKLPTVLLVHEPDYADNVSQTGHSLLQLSGHSHGGQVRVPMVGAPVTVTWGRKYVRGKFNIGNVQLYVNRGIGCTGKGVRFASPPEITEVTLVTVAQA